VFLLQVWMNCLPHLTIEMILYEKTEGGYMCVVLQVYIVVLRLFECDMF